MGLFRSRDVVGIARDAIEFTLEAAEDAHPDEYMALLRGERVDRVLDSDRMDHLDANGRDRIVTDVLVIPGTTSNPVSATVKTNMIPNDRDAVGSVHSHPNGVLRPSDEDLATFGRGTVHVILGAPYGNTDWRAFDRDGRQRPLPVVDIDLRDPDEFFDVTQAEIDAELADEQANRTDGRTHRRRPKSRKNEGGDHSNEGDGS